MGELPIPTIFIKEKFINKSRAASSLTVFWSDGPSLGILLFVLLPYKINFCYTYLQCYEGKIRKVQNQ